MKSILRSRAIQAAGPMPTPDPFLFCVYHKDLYPKGNPNMEAPRRGNGHDFDPNSDYRMYHGNKIPGFPSHPHRGFETITATIEGIVDHADSVGNAGRYGQGDVQWMTAGKGVVHGEMFPLVNLDEPNATKFFQIWLNLPKKDKMVDPSFAMFWANDIPKFFSSDGKASVTNWYGFYSSKDFFPEQDQCETISNNNGGDEGSSKTKENKAPPNSWASDKSNDVAVILLTIQPGGKLTLPKSNIEGINRSLYLMEGYDEGVQIGDKLISRKVVLDMDASESIELSLSENATNTCEILLLQGKAIDEPVAQHGPFVMNTREEISRAFDDYSRTKFGEWPWPRDDMVFPQEKKRFALMDGKETFPTGE